MKLFSYSFALNCSFGGHNQILRYDFDLSFQHKPTAAHPYVPWSKVAILGMVIPPFNRNPYNGYINPYYWVDDHPLLCGNNGSLDFRPDRTYHHPQILVESAPQRFLRPPARGRGLPQNPPNGSVARYLRGWA